MDPKLGHADENSQASALWANTTPTAFVYAERPSAPAMRIQQLRLALLRKLALYFAPAMRTSQTMAVVEEARSVIPPCDADSLVAADIIWEGPS